MKDFFTFCSESPVLTFFLFCIVGCTIVTLIEVIWFRPFNRYMRSRNIAAHGWPPAHCDADGDFKPEPEKDEEDTV